MKSVKLKAYYLRHGAVWLQTRAHVGRHTRVHVHPFLAGCAHGLGGDVATAGDAGVAAAVAGWGRTPEGVARLVAHVAASFVRFAWPAHRHAH